LNASMKGLRPVPSKMLWLLCVIRETRLVHGWTKSTEKSEMEKISHQMTFPKENKRSVLVITGSVGADTRQCEIDGKRNKRGNFCVVTKN